MEDFAELSGPSAFTQRRRQFMDDRLDALSQWGVYTLVVVGTGVGAAIVIQLTSRADPRSSDWFNFFFGLVFIVGVICMFVALAHGVLALWAWSTIAFRSASGSEAYPFKRFWRQPYGPRVALVLLVVIASVPAVYFRFHDPPLFFGILLVVALISKRIVSRF
jgi:hypothetical protein